MNSGTSRGFAFKGTRVSTVPTILRERCRGRTHPEILPVQRQRRTNTNFGCAQVNFGQVIPPRTSAKFNLRRGGGRRNKPNLWSVQSPGKSESPAPSPQNLLPLTVKSAQHRLAPSRTKQPQSNPCWPRISFCVGHNKWIFLEVYLLSVTLSTLAKVSSSENSIPS